MSEMDLLNSVRLAVSRAGCVIFRINVGTGMTKDGRFFTTGVPVGHSDLYGVRPDGRAFFIETKLHPRKPTKEQCRFLLRLIKQNACAGVAYTVEEALNIVEWQGDFPARMQHALEGVLLCRSKRRGEE